jgi:hypothetical protein
MTFNEEANDAFGLDHHLNNMTQNESRAKKDNECKGK